MALSPGVEISENDQSTVTQASIARMPVFAGYFKRGPIGSYVLITNAEELEKTFGLPDDDNANDWFQVFNLLQYGNGIYVTRSIGKAMIPIAEEIIFVPPPPEFIEAFGFEWGDYEAR